MLLLGNDGISYNIRRSFSLPVFRHSFVFMRRILPEVVRLPWPVSFYDPLIPLSDIDHYSCYQEILLIVKTSHIRFIEIIFGQKVEVPPPHRATLIFSTVGRFHKIKMSKMSENVEICWKYVGKCWKIANVVQNVFLEFLNR